MGRVKLDSLLKLFSILKNISHNMYNSFAKYFLITAFLNSFDFPLAKTQSKI